MTLTSSTAANQRSADLKPFKVSTGDSASRSTVTKSTHRASATCAREKSQQYAVSSFGSSGHLHMCAVVVIIAAAIPFADTFPGVTPGLHAQQSCLLEITLPSKHSTRVLSAHALRELLSAHLCA